MQPPGSSDVTALLLRWSEGNKEALDQLTPLVYKELRSLAARQLRRERPGHTLESTALVHEAYLKLVDQTRVTWHNREHFFAVASKIMRRILVNHARFHNRLKRGSGRTLLTLSEAVAPSARRDVDLEALDEALGRLSSMDEQQGRIIELRFFAGLSIEDTAECLQVSAATVKRDWNVARAWLFREMAGSAIRG